MTPDWLDQHNPAEYTDDEPEAGMLGDPYGDCDDGR